MNKNHPQFWYSRLFKPQYTRGSETLTSPNWAARVQHAGQRRIVALWTANKQEGAQRAADLYRGLQADGWDKALARLRPEEKPVRTDPTTVGSLLEHIEGLQVVGVRTFCGYASCMRWFAAKHLGSKGDRSKFDYKGGGNAAWREKIDDVPIASLTPAVIQRIVDRFVASRSSNPLEGRRAANSARSYIRNGRALFSKRLLKRITLPLPSPLPFDGIELPAAGSSRYSSDLDMPELTESARQELRESDPAAWIVFCLGFLSGLRKGEMDRLTWTAIRWDECKIWVGATEHGLGKSAISEDDVDVDSTLLDELRYWQSKGDRTNFVLPGAEVMPSDPREYRCDALFKRTIQWLRDHGVNGPKPLHVLRKEFGSHVCQHGDLISASRQLRHADLGTTSKFYVEARRRVAPSLGAVLPLPQRNSSQ